MLFSCCFSNVARFLPSFAVALCVPTRSPLGVLSPNNRPCVQLSDGQAPVEAAGGAGFCEWLTTAGRADETNAVAREQFGVDAAFFLTFTHTMFRLLLLVAVPCVCVLLPVHFLGASHSHLGGAHLPDREPALAAALHAPIPTPTTRTPIVSIGGTHGGGRAITAAPQFLNLPHQTASSKQAAAMKQAPGMVGNMRSQPRALDRLAPIHLEVRSSSTTATETLNSDVPADGEPDADSALNVDANENARSGDAVSTSSAPATTHAAPAVAFNAKAAATATRAAAVTGTSTTTKVPKAFPVKITTVSSPTATQEAVVATSHTATTTTTAPTSNARVHAPLYDRTATAPPPSSTNKSPAATVAKTLVRKPTPTPTPTARRLNLDLAKAAAPGAAVLEGWTVHLASALDFLSIMQLPIGSGFLTLHLLAAYVISFAVYQALETMWTAYFAVRRELARKCGPAQVRSCLRVWVCVRVG